MATIYSGYSKAWRPSGSSYDKKYRSYLTYTVTTYADRVVVSASMGVNINSSVNASYTGTLAATGYSTYSGSASTRFEGSKTVGIVGTKTYTYTRTTSAQTKYVTAGVKSSTGSWTGQNMTVTLTVNVPALGAYNISYDGNGGSGEIEPQTKYYNIDITLSDGTGLTWEHHTLLGWNTSADGSGTHYALGATYSANEDLSLYAEWQLNAVEGKAKSEGEWFDGIFHVKVDGDWVIPHKGYVKVNGEWLSIIKKDEPQEQEQ